ncbi:MAG: DUF2334 domain-containing protein [Balneolaceae bacterium]|nr:DUF2334 domain-containing protein [Balneolaceae bacterium]MBO6547474.1 DUF2334 domain-containing protein [Balneolaceae bacterium]MBO6647579.1 DUF2334 domain-containing protein [Balneolaceae bacterium]
MRHLCIGILELTPGWKSILDQIGVWYEEVESFGDLFTSYSVIIINKPVSEEVEHQLHEFNDAGGSIFETPSGDTFSHARFTVTKKIKSLINNGNIPFLDHISFLDVYSEAHLYNGQTNFDGLIDFEKIEDGIVCNFGINPDELIANNEYNRKRFFFKKKKHPDELVSRVSKKELVDLITSLLKELHFQQGLPFVNKWTSPKEHPVFAFRIDSDFGDKESVKSLHKIGKTNQVPMTWFLHVQAHEDWLNLFHEFEGQEIALHGYEHGTSTSYEQVFNNIEKGLQLLKDVGFSPEGFCVPYGIWNKTLAEVLQKFNFKYSSEFTVGYDGIPFYPIHNNAGSNTLQIPIHPICTGSLNRKNASFQEMKEYFAKVLEGKLNRYENVVFYHHPLQPGTEIWNDIFSKVNDLKLTKLSLNEYASFWKKRLYTQYSVSIDTENNALSFSGELGNLLLQVSSSHTSFELVQANGDNEVKSSGEFKYHTQTKKLSESEIEELKGDKFQLIKTSLLDWKNRIKL